LNSTPYQLVKRVHNGGEEAYIDHRHGHPSKMRAPLREWLVTSCREHPDHSARLIREALQDEHGVTISIGHSNSVRRQLGIGRKTTHAFITQECESAGSLLRLSAVRETGLLSAL